MSRKQWPIEVHELQKMIDEGLKVNEMELRVMVLTAVTMLKKIEQHLSIISDEEIDDIDVE